MRSASTKAEFDAVLASADAAGRCVVVDFTATWCGPCRAIAPAFEQMSAEFSWVDFLKVDVDANQETAAACGVRYDSAHTPWQTSPTHSTRAGLRWHAGAQHPVPTPKMLQGHAHVPALPPQRQGGRGARGQPRRPASAHSRARRREAVAKAGPGGAAEAAARGAGRAARGAGQGAL